MISVVIPLYNKAPHIARAIESVLAQTSPAHEIVIVDDGSIDGGAECVTPYVEKYGVRLIRQANAGVSVARNRGIDAASAEYVAFLDADDFWLPAHLEVLRRLIEKYPDAALLSTAHVIERGGDRYRPKSPYHDGWCGLVDNFFLRYAKGLGLINSITACVKKQDVLRAGRFPAGISRGEDIICWVNMALNYPVAHAEVVTAVYFQDAVNRTDQLRETEPPGSLKYIAQLLKGGNLTKQQRRGLAVLFDRIAFFTAAGYKVKGDVVGMNAIRNLAARSGMHRTALAIGVLMLTPAPVLRFARRFRHPRAKDQSVYGAASK